MNGKALLLGLALAASAGSLRAQSLSQDLSTFVQTPSVTGYEQSLAAQIRAHLQALNPRADNLGNVIVTLGTGSPSRLMVAPMDEPGYIVSAITPDGYLRVQRLPQQAPHPLFDLLHAAQPVTISTRTGKFVYGVVAGLSTHLQPGRQNAPRGAHPDEIFVDIGASSPAEVRQAGVDILDPISLDRTLFGMGSGRLTAPAVGDRFGCAALVELVRRLDSAKITGTLTIAFVAQQWASSRGLDRLMQQVRPDEMIYVGRLLPPRGPGAQTVPRTEFLPGSTLLLAVADPQAPLSGFPAEIQRLATENQIALTAAAAASLPRVSYTQGPVPPQRFAHLGIPTRFPLTPAEFLDSRDLLNLVALLELYAQGTRREAAFGEIPPPSPAKLPNWGASGPSNQQILQSLVEAYGVSGHEGAVREVIAKLLPPGAKPETDPAGNLVLRFSATPSNAQTLARFERIAFIAHMDEIGYVVRSITADGKLEVQSRGGGISEFFLGHPVLVHAKSGPRPGVLELPQGWDAPDFQWPRGPQAQAAEARVTRVDVGARSPEEVAQLGIAVGDTLTVPKKYRKLFGTRANGRSFDDRVGCAALIAAVWALGPNPPAKEVLFIWSTEEEVGLRGARTVADRLAAEGRSPDYVFAVDTFVSSDSPLESGRFAGAPIGKGFVIRAVDNSNIVARQHVDRLVKLARANSIPMQYGVTGGGNDGAVFLRHGTVDIPISWPLRYSHSPAEVIDTRDLDALARLVALLARSW